MPAAEPTSESAELSPAEVWQRLSDGLVAGIHHSINNRLGALTAVAQVLEMEVPPGHPLHRSLGLELERLQETVKLLALVARESAAPAEPLQVTDLLAGALRLFREHHDLRDLPLTSDGAQEVLPVYGEPVQLMHAVVTAMAAVGRAVRRGAGTEVQVRCSGDSRFVTLEITAGGAENDGAGGGDGLEEVRGEAAGAMLERWGGRVEVGEAGRLVRLLLPTLLEARGREGR